MRYLPLLLCFFSFQLLLGQNEQDVFTAPEDKARVFIMRTNSIGAAINFRFFLQDQFIGKFNFGKYMVLDLDPGEHLLWASSENQTFMEMSLESGKTYVVNAIPEAGVLKAGVRLEALTKDDWKKMKRVKRHVLNKKQKITSPKEKAKHQTKFKEHITKSLQKYKDKINSSERVVLLKIPVDFTDPSLGLKPDASH